MGEAAVALAHAAGYTNAGTVEFLVDAARNFYFLEVNTRLQVEHPVTEMVTGLDVVKLQILIAAGESLPFAQEDINIRGHAIECRVYAEDPDNNFFPSPGKILARRVPHGPGIRLDDGVYPGWTVPTDYDPLLGKVIAWGRDRAEAIARLRRALEEYYATGIKINTGLFRRILADPEFAAANFHTRWLDERLKSFTAPSSADRASRNGREHTLEDAALIAAVLWHVGKENATSSAAAPASQPESHWKLEGRREQLDRAPRD
jgi:acetyl-CoA carboxylase biotin carboxylase subunit